MSITARLAIAPLATLALTAGALASFNVVTTFENGSDGWQGPQGAGGSTFIEPDGNPGNAMRTIFTNFGITFSNTTNPALVRDLSSYTEVTFSIDTRVNQISTFGGAPSIAPWLVEFRDFDNGPSDLPYDSVWFLFSPAISADLTGEWTTFSVTFDATSTTMPDGWGGFGDETLFGDPILPAHRTFADIMATFDEIAITTFQPGFGFPSQLFDISIDNITLRAVPTPGAATLLGAAGLVTLRRRRR